MQMAAGCVYATAKDGHTQECHLSLPQNSLVRVTLLEKSVAFRHEMGAFHGNLVRSKIVLQRNPQPGIRFVEYIGLTIHTQLRVLVSRAVLLRKLIVLQCLRFASTEISTLLLGRKFSKKIHHLPRLYPGTSIHFLVHVLIDIPYYMIYVYNLGGGNSNIFIFTPTWGHDPIWRAYFSNGLKSLTS